jgi:hypothetical protein
MAGTQQSRGDCAYCGREMTRTGMAHHLKTCASRLAAQVDANQSRRRTQTIYHLQVQDAWNGCFWLHLEMRGNATLQDLDEYLRAIWLECCGHLSAFAIDPWRYTQILDWDWADDQDKPMNVRVDQLFVPGMDILYEYDFGSTSSLTIKVLAQRQGKPTTPRPVFLMARNKLDHPPCMECGKPAIYLCTECYERQDGACELCAQHAVDHPHEESLMPLVNSPRTGMCGYIGPAEPPY